MRIIYHHRTLGDGAEGIHILAMVSALRGLGHDVQLVSLVDEASLGIPNAQHSKNGRWFSIGKLLPGFTYELAEIAYNVVGKRALRRAIKSLKPDFIYDRYNTFSSCAVEAAREANIPVLLEVNAPVAYERTMYEHRPLTFSKLAQRFEQRICTQASHVLTVSSPLRDFLIAQRGVLESNVTVLPNGVDPRLFAPASNAPELKARIGLAGKTVIGFAGILRPWHGIELLLEAIARLRPKWPDLHLLIIGGGAIENELRQRAAELGLSLHVTFTGRVAHTAVKNYLGAIDIAVSPRATFYASPMKIVEYMAMGLATVAPDMPNICDLIDDGESGMLFTPDQSESLSEKLECLLRSPTMIKRIGINARAVVENRLNWQTTAEQVLQIAANLRD
jgi:glycosyltransferase involved in cell wall biosynthesis